MATTIETRDGLIKISFPYDPQLVAKVRLLTGSRWVPGERCWSLPYSDTAMELVRAIFPEGGISAAASQTMMARGLSEVQAEELKYLPAVKDAPITDFTFKTTPYWHQKVTFGFARALDSSAIFLEQGLGKAKCAIDLATWRYRKGQIKRCVVVCPVSVMGQWVVELGVHGHDDFKEFVLLEGASAKRQKVLDALPADWCGFIIINYDGLLPLRDYLMRRQQGSKKLFDMLVLDESSRIKHATSMRSKLTWKLGTTVRYRNLLTGTPITQSIEDIFAQYRFLDTKIFGPYATAFRSQFLIMGGFENREIRGYKNVPALMKRIYSVAIRFTKDRCLDLPPKVYERRDARLNPEATAKYLEFEKRCVAEFDGKTISAQLVMTKLMKLSQITGGFVYEQGPDGEKIGAIKMSTNPKLEVLEEILEENAGKKIIVWFRFQQERDVITELLKKKKVRFVTVTGGIPMEVRKDAVAEFQNNPETQVFLGQISTAGFGITLTAAELAVFYSNSYSYEERAQAEDRCHRIGLKHSVTYIDLVAVLATGRKTIDHDILAVKDGKARLANEVSAALMQQMVTRAGAKAKFKISGKDITPEETEVF